MDRLAQFLPQIATLPPEKQQEALDLLARDPSLLPDEMPVQTEAQIGNVTGSRRGDAAIDSSRARLERALASQQGSENELMAGISGPRAVPSAWGPIMVRQSPIMNVVKAIRAYQGGAEARGAEKDLEGQYDAQEKRLGGYLGDVNEQNRAHNTQATQDAYSRLLKALGMGI